MDAFTPVPPQWADLAIHAFNFCCPKCGATADAAESVWINRQAPVFTLDHRRKWQEFYKCNCGAVWWAWSSDRPPNDFDVSNPPIDPYLDDDGLF